MAMQRLSDVMQKRPWHPDMQRRYLIRTVATCVVMIVLGSIIFYRMAITPMPGRTSIPPPTVDDLLEALKQKAVNP